MQENCTLEIGWSYVILVHCTYYFHTAYLNNKFKHYISKVSMEKVQSFLEIDSKLSLKNDSPRQIWAKWAVHVSCYLRNCPRNVFHFHKKLFLPMLYFDPI